MPKTVVKTKKQTFSLDKEVVNALEQLANKGAIISKSDFVERAIKANLKKKRDEWLSKEFARAAKDPLFLADVEAVQKDFEYADAESASMIE
ncbi:ribbon-helix-helix protein, CopG family [Candidatus Berkelbacteria bacterium]|nr:ribbon-helix-helix protein, CopG family [Candidatus Berkelbacteria bacterium]